MPRLNFICIAYNIYKTMSESFQTVCVKDDRLNCRDHIKYAVEKGGANVTFSDIVAISASNSSHVYNVIVPSEQTVIDRRVEWGSQIQFRLVFPSLPAGNGAAGTDTQAYDLVQYGAASALCAFPLHSCTTVVSATINNNTVSQNMDDVLQPMIRFMDRKKIHKYTGTTPVMPDNYLNYADGLDAINNVLGSYNNSEKESDYHARGAFTLVNISTDQVNKYAGAYSTVYAGAALATPFYLYVTAQVNEPFMLSPFIFAHEKQNDQGFYGVQNLNFRMNINANARIWRQAPITNEFTAAPVPIPLPSVQIDAFPDATLTFCYLTPHPEDLLPAKNCVGFLEMPRYITAGQKDVAALATVAQLSSQTLQLNQVPDKLVIMVRRKNLTVGQTDSYLPIENISINWNNASGLLATASQYKLWLMSVEAGIQQSWLEWSGQAHTYAPLLNGGAAVSPIPPLATPLVGGILALDFAKDIQLTESYYAPGSLGTFQLQIRLTVFNQDPVNTVTAANYEIVIITLNSGVFVNERGTSSTYTGILTKQDVLDASSKPAYFKSDVERCVGGSMMDNLKTVVGHALEKHGGGMSGGMFTHERDNHGAGMSGGKHRKMDGRVAK